MEAEHRFAASAALLYSPVADFTTTASLSLIVPLGSCGCLREVYAVSRFVVCFVWVLLAAAVVGTSPLVVERLCAAIGVFVATREGVLAA